MKKRWRARNNGGKVVLETPQAFEEHVKGLGQELAVTVETWRRTTTNPQFAYYYGVVLQILSDFTGFTRDEMDVVLRNRFLSEFTEIKGQILRKTFSKTTVSTLRFNQFLDEVKRWAAQEFDLYIPDPNEVELDQFVNS